MFIFPVDFCIFAEKERLNEMAMEIWKDIPGYDGKYQVSNYGRVRSTGFDKWHPGRILKLSKVKKGYLRACLLGKFYLVHRLVWEAFNGPIPAGMQVNHIDEDKTNNRLDNLNLMTPKENSNWGTKTKRFVEKMTNRKDCSKWVIKLNKKNEILHFYPSIHQAQKETGVDYRNISACCTGKRETSGGFIWKYAD